MSSLLPQILGLLAVATFLLSYQQKKRKNIIITNVVSRLLYIFQYLLLGAFSGAVLDVLGMISSLIAERKHSKFIKSHIKLYSKSIILFSSFILFILITCSKYTIVFNCSQ